MASLPPHAFVLLRYIYDIEAKRTTAQLVGHDDDVNAVAYLDPSNPNIIASGSDDNLIKIWVRGRRKLPVD